MAEIKIEKKKPIWPWFIVILIILAAIYFFWYNNDRNHDSKDNMMENDTISQLDESAVYDNRDVESPSLYNGKYGTVRKEQALADYLNFIDNQNNMVKDHEYYRATLFKLVTATKREAEIQNVDIDANVTAAMKSAEMVTNDPASTENKQTANHTDKIKNAADQIAQALQTIQQKKFSDLSDDFNAVQNSVSQIKNENDSSQEQQHIEAFFDKAAVLLQKMYGDENKNL